MAYYKTYKGKKLGPYDYPRKTHFFTAEDVARIAKTVAARDGNSAAKVFATIAVALGFGATVCVVAKNTRSMLSLTFFLKKLAISLAAGQVIKVILQTLLGVTLKAPPGLNVVLAIVIAALVLIDSVIDAIPTLINGRDDMLATTDLLNNLCKYIKEISGDAVDIIEDTSAFDYATKKIDDAAFEFKSNTDQAWEVLVDTSWWDRFLAIFD